jgi:drug/metabolite transporter (DMT)-like permease
MIVARHNYKAGLIFVSVAAVAWSLSGLFTRFIATDTPTILFWRGLFGASGLVLVLVLVPATGGLRSFRNLGKPGFAYAAITILSMLLFISALRQTTVAHVAVITATVPFFAAYLGGAILHERPERSAIAASTVALLGVAIMSGVLHGWNDFDFTKV